MKKLKPWLNVVVVVLALAILAFAVPPALSAKDTLVVLFGFLLFTVAASGSIVGLWKLLCLVAGKE